VWYDLAITENISQWMKGTIIKDSDRYDRKNVLIFYPAILVLGTITEYAQ